MPAWAPSNGDRPPGVCPFALSPLPVYSRAGAAETVERLGHLTCRGLASSANRPAGRPTGIEPRLMEWHNTMSPEAYVVSKNLHRRHLNESQRAMVAAKMANVQHGQNQHTVEDLQIWSSAAEMLNIGERLVYSAKTVLRDGTPEEIETVENGVAGNQHLECRATLKAG